ncbi:MAG: hypothetical protein EOO10_25980 [Chitinophagaceae bacterium]|nr:MAG: hypothetical protein EOO10_25980 [Chitinophagaceae bacterium]
MHYSPDYTISLPDGKKIPLLFKTKVFMNLGKIIGLEYEGLKDYFGEKMGIDAKYLPDALLQGAEWYALQAGQDFAYTKDDAYLWIDAMGGFYSQACADVVATIVAAYFGKTKDEFLKLIIEAAQKEAAPEKEVKKKNQSPGNGSTKAASRRASNRGK